VVFLSEPWYTFTVSAPLRVKRAISVCHWRMATVGSTIRVLALISSASALLLEEEESGLCWWRSSEAAHSRICAKSDKSGRFASMSEMA
jgi:hypothetical protein